MLKKLIREAEKSVHKKSKHAALVTKGGAILSIGVNRNNVHAEISALKKLWPSKRKGTKVLSIRINKYGYPTYARPCKKCIEYMKANKVSEMQYSQYSEGLSITLISVEKI